MNKFIAAVAQYPVIHGAPRDNLAKVAVMVDRAADAGAVLAVMPEMFLTGYDPRSFPSFDLAFYISELGKLSGEKGVAIVGSMPEKVGDKFYNASYLIDGEGTSVYHKVNLFGPTGEDRHFERGKTDIYPIDFLGEKLGITICYDLRFPEIFRTYTARGATFFALSSMWPIHRMAHFRALTIARAIENQAFVISTNAADSGPPIRFGGGSLIVSPDGEVLAEADNCECLLTAELDFAEVESFRTRIPAVKDYVERLKG